MRFGRRRIEDGEDRRCGTGGLVGAFADGFFGIERFDEGDGVELVLEDEIRIGGAQRIVRGRREIEGRRGSGVGQAACVGLTVQGSGEHFQSRWFFVVGEFLWGFLQGRWLRNGLRIWSGLRKFVWRQVDFQSECGQEFAGVLVTPGFVFVERFENDSFERRVAQGRVGELRDRFKEMAAHDFDRVFAVERRATAGHFVHDDAECVEVGECIDFFAGGLLGRHVDGGSDGAAGHGELTVFAEGVGVVGVVDKLGFVLGFEFGDAEIEDFYEVSLLADDGQEDVFGFEVAVNDTAVVCLGQAFEDLRGDMDDFVDRQLILAV